LSRDTDSSSPEPRGPGGSAYPPDADAPGGASGDERKTETTLTTRIRINIPGSRPIPPVVMRTPVSEEDDAARADADRAAAAPGAAAGPEEPAEEPRGPETTQSTSDWFAPRRSPRPAGESTPPGGTPVGPTAGAAPDPFGAPAGGAPFGRADDEPFGHPETPAQGFPAVGDGDREARGEDTPPRDPFADLLRDNPPPPPAGPTTGAYGRADDAPPAGSTQGLGTGRSPFADAGGPSGPVGPNGPGGAPDFGSPTPPPGRIASDTLVSGIPRVPTEGRPGFPESVQAAAVADEGGHDYFDDHDDHVDNPGRGRSRLVMVAVALVAVLGVAYGAGLLLDHADVPNGTTVLGVDIGGKDKQEAVDTLDAALGHRATAPLTVVIDGKKEQLKPSVAGLTLDTEETVRNASGRDYNPVSVIGSLFGGTRQADPALKVDQDKLRAALTTLSADAGAGGGAKDGMVKFVNGKAVAVPGKPHKAVDVQQAAQTVEAAYRKRAAGGKVGSLTLPVSVQQPKIGKAQLQAAVHGFGKTAMSGWVWLKAGDVVVPFSQQTVSTFLTMKPGGGQLQPVIDTKKLAAAYGSSFDGVVIDAGAGTVKMTPQHAAAAMIQALKEPAPPTPQKRLAVVPGARSK
jgi:hypothetical protein